MINIFLKKKLKKTLIAMLLITHFSCYISLAAEMSADNYTKLTDNIVAWKNIDNADIVLSNGQDISNIATKKTVEIQEQEEEIITSNNLDLCLILDCSGSMSGSLMNDLKSSAKNLIEGLSNDCQLRITLISFGVDVASSEIGENAFYGGGSGGRKLTNLESNIEVVIKKIYELEAEGMTPTGEAINFADEIWSRSPVMDSTSRQTVLITDGYPNRGCSCSRCIKDV